MHDFHRTFKTLASFHAYQFPRRSVPLASFATESREEHVHDKPQ
jgi:hypothetical protein